MEPKSIRKARQIWGKVDHHTRRRTLQCFGRLYQTSQTVTISSLTCVMPEIVWTLGVEDLRDVWHAYRTSMKSSEREGQTIAPLRPPSPPITMERVMASETPDSPASIDVRTTVIAYLEAQNALLAFQERLVTTELGILRHR